MAKPSAKRAATSTRRALVVATRDCEICYASPMARRWLKQFFARPPNVWKLPRKICRWLASADGVIDGKSLVKKRSHRILFIRRHKPSADDAIALLLTLSSNQPGFSSRSHGKLTPREAEVLHWIAAGKSNSEIAIILGLSAGTVGKHVYHIFQKLGVENRTAAASFARATG